MKDVEMKGIVEDLIQQVVNILDMNTLEIPIRQQIRDQYRKGLDNMEVKFNMNFVADERQINNLQKFTFDNIRGMNQYMADSLRKELTMGLMNVETPFELQKRVAKVMDIGMTRAKMIARTESVRAFNSATIDAGAQSGLDLVKEWSATIDMRTCPICRGLDGVQVPLDGRFNYNGRLIHAPPASHPNCRCTVLLIQTN